MEFSHEDRETLLDKVEELLDTLLAHGAIPKYVYITEHPVDLENHRCLVCSFDTKVAPRPSPEYMSSTDLKPVGTKSPLTLLPAAPLRAVAAVFEHGGIKYAPWNFQDTSQPQARLAELYSAILRHTLAAGDPSQNDIDPESGLHHILHAAASCLIAAHKLGLDYTPSKLLEDSGKGR